MTRFDRVRELDACVALMDVVDIVILGEFRNGQDSFLWALGFCFVFIIVTIGLTCYMYLYGILKFANGENKYCVI